MIFTPQGCPVSVTMAASGKMCNAFSALDIPWLTSISVQG